MALPKKLAPREIADHITRAIAAKRASRFEDARVPHDANAASFRGQTLRSCRIVHGRQTRDTTAAHHPNEFAPLPNSLKSGALALHK